MKWFFFRRGPVEGNPGQGFLHTKRIPSAIITKRLRKRKCETTNLQPVGFLGTI